MVKVQDEDMATEPAYGTQHGRHHYSHHHHHHHPHHPHQHNPHNQHQNGTKLNHGHFHHPAPMIRFPPGFEPKDRYVPGNTAPAMVSGGSVSPDGTPQHVVDFHVYPGVTVSLQMGDNVQVYEGPVTVPMVSTNSSPPIPMPVQVPPGHMIQQVVDESGALRHVILSANPHPILPMQTHYGPAPAGGGGNGPPQPFFAPGGMPPYPGPHFAPFGPSPPPAHFHKDERSQRQYNKLKRKLEQKQHRSEPSPPFSPRKDLTNGTGKPRSKDDLATPGTSEDGDADETASSVGGAVEDDVLEEEDDTSAVVEFLSSVKEPVVAELTSRSALLTWPALNDPEMDIPETELVYEVLLADTAKGGKYRSIYTGISLSCRIEDLRPGSQYSVCLKVHHIGGLQGVPSPTVDFTTPPCPPDTPAPPKLLTRTRHSLQLRWNAPPDNGAPITQYILEYDEGNGNGSEFVEVCKNRNKQHNVIKLLTATIYRFRIAAVNECGRSAYSEIVTFSTCGNPPTQPAPPQLQDAAVTSLKLAWQKRPSDEEFTLQMDDNRSGHGFLPVYTGPETICRVEKLTRHSDYKFRLRAQNEEGTSRWSDEVTFRTLPAPPAAPSRPAVKGKIHASSFRVRWDAPHDRGGADVTRYIVELNAGNGYDVVYEGPDTECLCDRLKPGTCHQVRVTCCGPGGRSIPSEAVLVTTEAVCPGPCAPPRPHGKPRPHSLTLKFNYPEYDGGAPITQLEIEMTAPDASKRVVHSGPDTECTVTELAPGQPYVFHLRAHNRIGCGPWSEGVEVLSGAAAPDALTSSPSVTCRTPHTATLSWSAPAHNGAPITGYRVEMATAHVSPMEFTQVPHVGVSTVCDVRGLQANTAYFFRVLAINAAGLSQWSEITTCRTPPSAPGTVTAVRCVAHCDALSVTWCAPPSNGSEILHYNVDCGERIVTAASDGATTAILVNGLRPETLYRVRVQAVNAVGAGPFSSAVRASTLPLPPAPPTIECIAVGHNFLKLRWSGGDGGRVGDRGGYTVEMMNPRTNEFQLVYEGKSYTHKISRLHELSLYTFRVCASNEAGRGAWGEPLRVRTALAPPPPPKALRVAQVTHNTCTLEWSHPHQSGGSRTSPSSANGGGTGQDPLLYQVQLSRVKAQEFRVVYRGEEPRAHLSNLESNAEYCVRVCAVRLSSEAPSGGQLAGPFASAVTFATPPSPPSGGFAFASSSAASTAADVLSASASAVTADGHAADGHFRIADSKHFTDQQWAIIILSMFSIFAVLVAVGMQHLIDWRAQH